MRKKIVGLCIALILVIVSGVLIFIVSDKTIDVAKVRIEDFKIDINIGKLRVKSFTDMGRQGLAFVPENEVDVENLVTESEFYVDEASINIEGIVARGWLLYKDNNLYFLYKRENEGVYLFVNVYSYFSYDEYDYIFPALAKMSISEFDFQLAERGNYDLLGFIYDNFTYTEAKEIYSNFKEDYVVFEDKTKQIKIKAYDEFQGTFSDNPCIVLDFVRRSHLY